MVDYHALPEDCPSSACQCCLFCLIRYGSILVSRCVSSSSYTYILTVSRIIGIQSFEGSLRRTCFLSPTLGVDEIQLDSQFCGGYIDPTSLNVTSYVRSNGEHADSTKGYICPLGQVCKVSDSGAFDSFIRKRQPQPISLYRKLEIHWMVLKASMQSIMQRCKLSWLLLLTGYASQVPSMSSHH